MAKVKKKAVKKAIIEAKRLVEGAKQHIDKQNCVIVAQQLDIRKLQRENQMLWANINDSTIRRN